MKSCTSLVVLALALSACDKSPAEQSSRPRPTPEVGVITLKKQPVALTTELPGRTTAFLTSDVRPQVSGIVTARTFVEGSDVKSGEQLYQIDPATYQATYDSALATLAHDKAALESAKAKTSRYKPLAAAQAVSKQDYDDAVASSDEATADIASAQATIEQAKINLGYTKVMAPISGRIGRSTVTPGALVTADQTTALATVTQLDPIYVDLTQPASTLLRFRKEIEAGQVKTSGPNQAKIDLLLEDGSKYPMQGTLQFSEVNVDEGTGTVLIRAIFPNPNHMLLPGLYVRAELQEGMDDNAMLIPQQAVSHNSRGDPTALVLGPDNKVVLHILKTDRTLGSDWVVTGGVAPGDRVIVDGLQKITVGDVAKAVELTPDEVKSLTE